ncbi:MAG: hypothetical protein LBK47_04115 [Prevotellaceae bacterium]|jgi:hypothetical protein|nr:hypothetical protein [Prevotellaceae bacterium]
MKRNVTVAMGFALCALCITSCGGSKVTQVTNQTKRTQRVTDECITLSEQESSHLRAYGTATAFNENVAVENAEFDAATKLAQRMEFAVEGVRSRYNQTANKGLARAEEQIQKNRLTQYIAQSVKGYKVIKTSMWDRADGGIDAYVCVEMTAPTDNLAGNVYDSLRRDDILGIEFDRAKFIEETKEGLEAYKQSKK